MGAAQIPGPLGVGVHKPVIDTGTTPRAAMPVPAPTGLVTTPPPAAAAAAVTEDTRIRRSTHSTSPSAPAPQPMR